MVLDAELRYFESIKDDLLRHSETKFALIIGKELLGIFDNPGEAYKTGIEKRGNVPMLIKQVLKEDTTARVPAMMLGLLHART
jgi:hypothetical protein